MYFCYLKRINSWYLLVNSNFWHSWLVWQQGGSHFKSKTNNIFDTFKGIFVIWKAGLCYLKNTFLIRKIYLSFIYYIFIIYKFLLLFEIYILEICWLNSNFWQSWLVWQQEGSNFQNTKQYFAANCLQRCINILIAIIFVIKIMITFINVIIFKFTITIIINRYPFKWLL